MPRARHPDPEIERALRYAAGAGWRVDNAGRSSHAWGRIYCPYNDPECRCGRFCVISIWCTPRSPHDHARQIVHRVDGCRHADTAASREERTDD